MPFDQQPVLEGDLLELRPLRAEDFRAVLAAASDPLIWAQHPDSDRHREPVFRKLFDEMLASGGALVARDLADGTVIGWSRFHGYVEDRREVQIGFSFIVRSHWGGRYNGEMKRLMIAHAFRFVDRILFVIGPDNIRSQRAIQKIGAVPAGRRPDLTGRDSLVFEIREAGVPSAPTG